VERLLNKLSDTGLLIIDDFPTVGIDPDAASDLFAILANREHRRPTMIASQSGPDYWATALPDRVAADSIVNRLANHARRIDLGDIDIRRLRGETRTNPSFWELLGVTPHRYQQTRQALPPGATRQNMRSISGCDLDYQCVGASRPPVSPSRSGEGGPRRSGRA
jgi:hypothetical protein